MCVRGLTVRGRTHAQPSCPQVADNRTVHVHVNGDGLKVINVFEALVPDDIARYPVVVAELVS